MCVPCGSTTPLPPRPRGGSLTPAEKAFEIAAITALATGDAEARAVVAAGVDGAHHADAANVTDVVIAKSARVMSADQLKDLGLTLTTHDIDELDGRAREVHTEDDPIQFAPAPIEGGGWSAPFKGSSSSSSSKEAVQLRQQQHQKPGQQQRRRTNRRRTLLRSTVRIRQTSTLVDVSASDVDANVIKWRANQVRHCALSIHPPIPPAPSHTFTLLYVLPRRHTHQVRYCLASDLDDKRVAAFEAALAQATDQIGPCVAFVDVGGSDGRCTRGAQDDYWLLIVQAREEECSNPSPGPDPSPNEP